MTQELDWIRKLEAIRDKLTEDPQADWMDEWKRFNSIIEEAAVEHPEIKAWVPMAQETFGDDMIPADRVRELAEEAIRRLKPLDS